jgi:hypothetical protein
LRENFDCLELRPPLFYLWKHGIRFEISNPDLPFREKANLEQVYKRSTDIFNRIFDENDRVLLVTNVYCQKDNKLLEKRPLNIYRKYVKTNKL